MNYNRIRDFKNKDGEEYNGAERIEAISQSKEYSDDYILPEYLPDAKKVLEFICCPVLESRFVGNSAVEYNGTLFCRVLYLTEQSGLASASFNLPFEDKLTKEGITDDCVEVILPTVTSSSCRLQNPRKFNIRIKAGADIEIWKRRSYMPELYGSLGREDERCIESKSEPVDSMWVTSVREDEMSLCEDIVIDKSMTDIDKVIHSRADIVFDECRGGNNELICRGSCIFECIYQGSDGQYVFMRKSIPISENLQATKVNDRASCTVYAICKPPEVSVREDEVGQRRILEIDLEYGIEAVCFIPKSIMFTSDAFSTSKEVQNSFEQVVLYSCLDKITGGFSVNESIILDEGGIGREDKIISSFCTPCLAPSKEAGKKGKLCFEGECAFSLLLQKPDLSVYPASFSIPLKYECDRSFLGDDEYESKNICRASNVRLRMDNEKMYTDFEISFYSVIIGLEKQSCLESIRLLMSSSKESRPRSVITVCYPQTGEDEWSVAKKYKISRDELAGENGINKEMPPVLKIPSAKSSSLFEVL